VELIQSKENAFIKQVRKLKEKRYRTLKDQFLVEGFRFTEEALISQYEVPYLFIDEKHINKWEDSKLKSKLNKNTKVYLLKEQVFKFISSTDTPQGVIAVVNNKKDELINGDGFYVLVDRLQDPGNMGTIIRTAHAAGALGLLYTKGTVDVFNEKTLRSSMGSIFHIPVIEDEDLSQIGKLKERGFTVVVSSLDTDNNFYDVDLKKNVIICIGNEGNGISEEVFALADTKIKIPMPGGAESLNAAAAASIMIFEVVRQKQIK
jgi:RNA methyltransferase, TrmH family